MAYIELAPPRRASRAASGPYGGCGCSGQGAVGGYLGLGALNAATNVYTVEQGDYVAKIASKMGCAGGAPELIKANPGKNLGSGKIFAGQQIAIPPTCSGYVQPAPAQPDPGQVVPGTPSGINPQDPSTWPGYPGGQAVPGVQPGMPGPAPGPQYPSYPSDPGAKPLGEEEWGLFGLGTAATVGLGVGVLALVGGISYWALKSETA